MTNKDSADYMRAFTPKLRWWLSQIVDLLVSYAGMTETEAKQKLLHSNIPALCDGEPDWVTRENPFYWAMEILHSGKGNVGPFWWHDPEILAKYQEYIKWFNSLSEEQRLIPD